MGKYSGKGGTSSAVDNVTDFNFGGSSGKGGAGNTVSGVNFRNQVDNFPDMNSSGFRAKVNEFSSKTVTQFKDAFKKLQDKFSGGGKFSRTDAEDSRAMTKSAGDKIESGKHPSELMPNTTKAEVDAKMNDPDVQEAANVRKSDLAKLGLKGAAGVAFLMVLTKKNNPIDAINLFLDKTSEAFKAILKGLEKILKFFSNYGVYMSLCCCCLLFLLFATSVLKN
jgi:hypothetical protein